MRTFDATDNKTHEDFATQLKDYMSPGGGGLEYKKGRGARRLA